MSTEAAAEQQVVDYMVQQSGSSVEGYRNIAVHMLLE